MRESAVWAKMRERLAKMPGCHYQRIESGCVNPGIPDLNVCIDGVEFWVELKFESNIKRGGKVHLSKLTLPQILWLRERQKAGGRCGVLAYIGEMKKWIYTRDIELMKKLMNGQVNKDDLTWCNKAPFKEVFRK